MGKELIVLIKTIGVYDLIIGIIISFILSFFFEGSSLLFLLGIVLGFINFVVNSYTTRKVVAKTSGFSLFTIILSLLIRITLICGMAIIIISKSEVNFFIFISGYISQILSIVCYGVNLRGREGV